MTPKEKLMSMLRTPLLIGAALVLTACPERPAEDQAKQACENLLFIANQHTADAKTEAFQPLSDEAQLNTALDAFTKSLGEDKRAAALTAFRKGFKPVSVADQTKKAEVQCASKLASDLSAEARSAALKACLDKFKAVSNEDQEKAALAELEKKGSLPKAGTREAKIADFKKSFKPQGADAQKEAAKQAILNQLAKDLEARKASDPKYKETLDTCVKGLRELGTIKQAECMLKASTKKQAEACRNER
tara:strand:+ start:472 stop:1212 length:741 start_codon:yes stop_codon:yes gene_type:complete